jgi:hypothetical protein
MVKPVLLAALICAAPVCPSSAQDVKVSVDMMGIGGMSCAHWQSTQAHRSEGTVWIYGFWTGLNYVASASEQTETKVDTAAIVVESRKHAFSARRRYWPAPCGPLILTSIRGDGSPLTPGAPLVHSGSEGCRCPTAQQKHILRRLGICGKSLDRGRRRSIFREWPRRRRQ